MKQSSYTSKTPDAQGFVQYTQEENETWGILFDRQMGIIPNRAAPEFIDGINILGLNNRAIPQLPEINAKLLPLTGWQVAPVPALIDFDSFFKLLSEKKFPAATFIRTREELDYLQEPDIFHELFGHCPLLTLKPYAEFMHKYAQLSLNASHKDRVMLARLYWFTIEFGLIQSQAGLRIYGGGILSSYKETLYALEDHKAEIKHLVPLEAFRTPYRIDILQPIYFVIEQFASLFDLAQLDLFALIEQARTLGMHAPKFEPKAKTTPQELSTDSRYF